MGIARTDQRVFKDPGLLFLHGNTNSAVHCSAEVAAGSIVPALTSLLPLSSAMLCTGSLFSYIYVVDDANVQSTTSIIVVSYVNHPSAVV